MTSTMVTTALTYEELAARTGMSLASARRLVHRRKWRKAKGNDGRAVVQVPDDFLDHHKGKHPGAHDGAHHGVHDDDHDGAHHGHSTAHVDPSAMMADVMARLVAAQDNLVEMARKLGSADNEIAALHVQVDEMRAARDDARAERDRWAKIAEANQMQIAHLTQKRRGWWPFRRAS